jgi:hypothetical protein
MPLTQPRLGPVNGATITAISAEGSERQGFAYGWGTPATGSPVANLGYLFPFSVSDTYVVQNGFIVNGTAVAGNVDIGIYDGSGNRLVSSGAIAQSGTSTIQLLPMSYTLSPGLYYCAFSASSASANFLTWPTSVVWFRIVGHFQITSGHPLPSTATLASPLNNNIPIFGLTRMAVL